MNEYTVYLIQYRDKCVFWIDHDFGHDKIDGLPERVREFSGTDFFGYRYRLVMRTIREEVIHAPEAS